MATLPASADFRNAYNMPKVRLSGQNRREDSSESVRYAPAAAGRESRAMARKNRQQAGTAISPKSPIRRMSFRAGISASSIAMPANSQEAQGSSRARAPISPAVERAAAPVISMVRACSTHNASPQRTPNAA